MRKLTAFILALTVSSVVLVLPQPSRSQAAIQESQPGLETIGGHPAAANRVIVKFRDAKSRIMPAAIAQSLDVDSDNQLGAIGARLIHSRSRSAAALIAELSQRDDVVYAEPDYLAYGGATPNDSFYASQQWGLHNTGQTISGQPGIPGADVSAQQAWDISHESPDQVVAILDSGIDYNHPDLSPNTWTAAAPFSVTISGVTINCPAGSHGVNTINNTCDPLDDHNHGSNVSGIIGAAGNNGIGVTGINWRTQLLGIKWLNSNNSGFISDAIDALEVAVQLKQAGVNIKVLNNSWFAGGFSQSLLDEIRRVQSNDLLFVAIAGNGTGNDGFTLGGHDNDNGTTPTYPSNYNEPGMISVVATTNRDELAFFSNWGKQTVHLGAPGNVIFGTLRNSAYGSFSGTSQAAPHVAGAAALLLSRCQLKAAGLKGVLITNVDADAALAGKTTSGGRLNIARALNTCMAYSNIVDESQFFVRQQYVDFLSREPDASGFDFWRQNIESCGADAQCRQVRRIDTSAAFFLSIEFQQTGYLVYRIYKAAFGNLTGNKPVPVQRTPFLTDTRTISKGVVVLQPGWEQQLEANKVAFTQAFVQRAQFIAEYPNGMNAAAYVDKLFQRAGVTPTTQERNTAISAYGSGDTVGRAAALRSVAENSTLQQQEFNSAFVLMEYFGYLQRDPDAAPDSDFAGFNFWLGKLNQFNGNYIAAEMVKAFLESIEYRSRF